MTEQTEHKEKSKRIKDNLYEYGGGTVFGAIIAGVFVNSTLALVIVAGAALVGSVALAVEYAEERKRELKSQDLEDIQMLMLHLSDELERLRPQLSDRSADDIERKLKQLEDKVQGKPDDVD